jgi:hypothetical protein
LSAIAFPIPRAAPVMRAVFPESNAIYIKIKSEKLKVKNNKRFAQVKNESSQTCEKSIIHWLRRAKSSSFFIHHSSFKRSDHSNLNFLK